MTHESLARIYQLEADIAKYETGLAEERDPVLRSDLAEKLRIVRKKTKEELEKLPTEIRSHHEEVRRITNEQFGPQLGGISAKS